MGIIINGLTDTVTASDQSLNLGGNVTIPGELSYDDVTSIDSVGVVTARAGINATGDITFGANSKAKLFENGTQSGVQATSSTSSAHLMTHDGNEDIHVDPSGYIKVEVAGSEKLRITSGGTLESYSPDDTTPNIKWRSNDTNWYGSLNQSVEGGTITSFLSCGGDWSANGTTYSATKAIAAYPTSAIAVHNQYNSTWGSEFVFLTKAGGSTTTDGAVTERLRITSDGQVIVNGTTNLGHPNMDDVIVGDASGNRGITVASGTSNYGTVAFGDSADGSGTDRYEGFIEYYHDDNSMRLGTVHSERLRITSTGQLLLGINNAVASDVNFQIHGASSGVGPILNMTNDTGDCRIFFGQDNSSGGANAQGQIRYNVANNYLAAYAGGAERLRITSDGNVSVNHDSPNTRLYVRDNGVSISSTGNAILNSTQRGIRLVNVNNDDTSLGLWFTTGDAHHSGISGQRTDSASHWGTDLRFYTHEGATNDLTYTRERLRISCNGLLTNRKGNNAINTGGTILGRYKYTQQNQSQNYEHNILGPDGRNLNNYLTQNVYARIRIQVTGTGTTPCFCEYLYTNNSSVNSAALNHIRGNSSASSNRPYMVLNGQLPAWKMNHNGGYILDIEVAMYGGKEGYTYTTEYGNFGANP